MLVAQAGSGGYSEELGPLVFGHVCLEVLGHGGGLPGARAAFSDDGFVLLEGLVAQAFAHEGLVEGNLRDV